MHRSKQFPIDNKLPENPSIVPQWMIRLCTPSRMLWLGPLLGFLLTVPFFFAGYKCDDLIFKQQTNEKSSYFHNRAAWDYFNWVSNSAEATQFREKGILCDWFTPDGFRWHFFRPLTSLVHAFQFRYFGNAPWIMHVVLALLYGLLIYLCAKVLRRLSSSSIAAGIAILIFALDDIHSYSSGWISAYNTLLCCLLGTFALLMHDRWRRNGSIAGLLFFAAGFVLALLGSEGGIALMGYLVAYALFIENGSLRKKAASLIPGTIITFGYLFFYFSQQLGTKCNPAYLSPSDNPWLCICTVLSNTVIFSGSQLLSIAPLTAILQNIGTPGLIGAVVLLAGMLYLLRDILRHNKAAAFFGLSMVLSIAPFTLGFISDRLLLWAGLGGAGLVGEIVTWYTSQSRKPQRMFAKTVLATNTIVSLVFFVPLPFMMFSFANAAQELDNVVSEKNTVLLNASNGFAFMYGPMFKCEQGGAWPEHFYFFYCGSDTMVVKRTGERSFTATVANGWIADAFSKSRRTKQNFFAVGDTFTLRYMTATIEQITADGRPLRVCFTFNKDLSEFDWLVWKKKRPEKCLLPAIGDELKIGAPPIF